METGGFRKLARAHARGAPRRDQRAPGRAARASSISTACELGSQFYEPSLRTGRATDVKFVPPVGAHACGRPRDTRRCRPRRAGRAGPLRSREHRLRPGGDDFDLGILVDGGFRVLGRLRGAEARGCSIAADALLDPARAAP
jgi:hypothetical protein